MLLQEEDSPALIDTSCCATAPACPHPRSVLDEVRGSESETKPSWRGRNTPRYSPVPAPLPMNTGTATGTHISSVHKLACPMVCRAGLGWAGHPAIAHCPLSIQTGFHHAHQGIQALASCIYNKYPTAHQIIQTATRLLNLKFAKKLH